MEKMSQVKEKEYVSIESEEELNKEEDLNTLKDIYDKYGDEYKEDSVNEYVNARYKRDLKVALGVMMIIGSLSLPCFTMYLYNELLDTLAALSFLALIIIGIVFIVKAKKDFKRNKPHLALLNRYDRRDIKKDEYDNALKESSKLKLIGILSCVFSLLPEFIFTLIDNGYYYDIGGGAFVLMIAAGVFLIKISKSKVRAYKDIINKNV